jgi:hypothetical protein
MGSKKELGPGSDLSKRTKQWRGEFKIMSWADT